MKVQVNNKEVEMTPASTLTQLAAQLELPAQGIAIAVNNKNDSTFRMGEIRVTGE